MLITDLLLAAILLVGLWAAFNWWKKTRKFYAQANHIPGPTGLPIVGNLLEGLRVNFDSLKVIELLRPFEGTHGIVKCWAGHDLVVFISDPDHFEIFFNSNALLNRSLDYRAADEWFGEGNVLTSDGERWKKARRIMIQSFHTISQATFVESMVNESKDLIKRLNGHCGKGIFEFSPVFRDNANSLITRIAIDETFSKQKEVSKVLDHIDPLMGISVKRLISPIHYFNLSFPLTPDGRRFYKMTHELRSVMSGVIEDKRAELKEMLERGVEPPNRYIYNLLRKFGDEPIEDLTTHLISIFVTAVDTTTATAGFLMLVAGIRQDIQQKIYEEDQEVMKRIEGRELEPSDLQHYDYLDRVIKETLRCYPVGALVGRVTTKDVEFGEYVVPEGTNVFTLPMWTKDRADIFNDPYKFDPDRFLPENMDKLHPYAYLPFSHGAKSCAGNTFAMMSLKVVVSTIIRHFKVYSEYESLDEVGKNLLWTVTIKDKNDARIRLEPRIKD